jgi:hypothetical protein
MELTTLLNYASALSAFVAAVLWYVSATIQVPRDDKPDSDGWVKASISVDGNDFIASAIAQQKWGRRGAFAAALAAFTQGLSIGLAALCAA